MNFAVAVIWSYFEDFLKEHTLEPVILEKAVCNTEIGYAGTLDYYGMVDGKLAILDFKTSKAIYQDNTFGAQLAAYKRAFTNKAENLYILRMNENTGVQLAKMPDDWELFQKAMALYKEQHPDRLAQKV